MRSCLAEVATKTDETWARCSTKSNFNLRGRALRLRSPESLTQKVRSNGPWTLAAVKRLFLVAPQCPEAEPGGARQTVSDPLCASEGFVWPALADRIVALTKQARTPLSAPAF